MPTTLTLDTRGLSCPQPALQASRALRGHPEGLVEILVDAGAPLDNVVRIAERAGWSVASAAQPDGSITLLLRK